MGEDERLEAGPALGPHARRGLLGGRGREVLGGVGGGGGMGVAGGGGGDERRGHGWGTTGRGEAKQGILEARGFYPRGEEGRDKNGQ